MRNNNLSSARRAKNDEFYTLIEDVEREVSHYKQHLENKTVYCPCDNPTWSNFYLYLKREFKTLGLKKLVATHYLEGGTSYKREYDGTQEVDTPLEGDGDFRSSECKTILNEADIVITNPPFSLFREFVSLLVEKEKLFLLIGNNNAITYREIFKLIKDNKLWLGTNSNKTLEFRLHPSYEKWSRIDEQGNKYGKVPAISWFTNLTHFKRTEDIFLFKEYNPLEYPSYDNLEIIEVSKVRNIPKDYYKPMGVPITFLDKYNPNQFEILGLDDLSDVWRGRGPDLNGKAIYRRIIIKRKPISNAD